MNPEEVMLALSEKLERCGITFAGSFASNLHGTPRTTYGADVVVEINESRHENLAQALGFVYEKIGRSCWFATAEDTILTKLEWSKMGESERQFNDAVNITKVQNKNPDLDYLHRWSDDLRVDDLLNQLLMESGHVS